MNAVLPTIYVGCDGKYFNLYAETFIASIECNSPNNKVFFSICNPFDDFEQQLTQIKNLASNTQIEYEVYYKDLSDKTHEEKIGFYVNHRFVKLNEFFRVRQCNVLFIDIDSIIRNDLSVCELLFAHSDVAIQLRLEEKRARVRVLGAGILIRYNERTLDFMQKLADALLNQYTWFTDQLQIYLILKRHPLLKVSDFEKAYLDWEFAHNALIWTGKGERKFLDEKYTGYADFVLAQFRDGHFVERQNDAPQVLNTQPLVNLRRPYRAFKILKKIRALLGWA